LASLHIYSLQIFLITSILKFINKDHVIEKVKGVPMVTQTSLQGDMRDAVEQFKEEEEAIFQWTKQWYPVAVVDFLDPSRPHAMQLLGKDIVLWRDGSGKWRCFEDFCPHRLAPLSEGRVEPDGTLLCAYHAWRFDSEGNCVSIRFIFAHICSQKLPASTTDFGVFVSTGVTSGQTSAGWHK
jgi:nitrite reductase/ring-hydroxylating ferredoxin subunit